jgi:hypothetical protein
VVLIVLNARPAPPILTANQRQSHARRATLHSEIDRESMVQVIVRHQREREDALQECEEESKRQHYDSLRTIKDLTKDEYREMITNTKYINIIASLCYYELLSGWITNTNSLRRATKALLKVCVPNLLNFTKDEYREMIRCAPSRT